MCRIRLRRILHILFGNRIVVVHPLLYKNIDTQSANAFGDKGIEGFLTGEGRQRYNFGG